jgi:hypothetical protein
MNTIIIQPIKIVTLRTEIQCSKDQRDSIGDELAKKKYKQVGLFDTVGGDFQLLCQHNRTESGTERTYLIVVITQNAKRHEKLVNLIRRLA